MTTKDDCLSFKDKHKGAAENVSGDQYRNLNLNNQNHDCVFEEIFRPKNIAFDNKKSQNYATSDLLDHSNDLKSKKASNSWSKSDDKHLSTTFLNLNNDFEARNDLKKSKSANNSTLSLHIAAYENSIETSNDSGGREKKVETSNFIKKWVALKHFGDGSISIIQNPFEFPRQQDDQDNRPELMEFAASQHLLNPNQMNANNQVRPPPLMNEDFDLDSCFNSEEDLRQEQELSQCVVETNEYASDDTSEETEEDDSFIKAVDFAPNYCTVTHLNVEMDTIQEQIETWVTCSESIKEDPKYLSLLQEIQNDRIRLRIISKEPLDLGMPTLILIYSNQNETLTFTTQISFSETCRSSILYSPPSNCQKLQSAYLVHSFKFNKYKYSLLKDIYEGPESDENVEEMDYDFLSNGTKRIEYKDKTEKSSSSLQGVFEGEHFNLADILGEDDESACDSGDESGSDSDTLSENEQQKDDFEQIFTYKLKIFVE